MRDLSALHTAFGGCGTTLANARKKSGISAADTAATLDLLGELLMATGTACLPGPTKNRSQSTADEARSWTSLTAGEQLGTLKALMGMLTNPPTWRGGEEPTAHKPMLPREMGRWDGNRNLPSCFGMLVILASYGYITKAPMLAASVQRMSAEPVAIGLKAIYGEAYRLIADMLPAAFRMDAFPGSLIGSVRNAEASMRLMVTRREFHGAIVIRLSDGRWVSLDPYMRNMAVLDPHTQPLDQIAPRLLVDPVSAATILGQQCWSEQPRLEQELRTVRGLLELARTDTVLHTGIPLLRLPDVIRALLTKHSQLEPNNDDILRSAVATPMMEGLPDVATARAMAAAAATGSGRQCLRERILLGAVRIWAAEAWRAAQTTRYNEPHHAMMLSAPARTLAVWAIINLRHRLGSPIHGVDLLPYSGSDVTLYNALIDHKNGSTTAADLPWLDKRRARFQQAPPYLLHPLILETLR